MPFQTGIIKVRGTIGDVTYYYAQGKHLCRRRTSLNKDRIFNDPAFEKTRQYLPVFGAASRLASIVHSQLTPVQKRKVRNYKLIKEIIPMIRQNLSSKKIIAYMKQRYGVFMKGFAKIKNICDILRNVHQQQTGAGTSITSYNPTTLPGMLSSFLQTVQNISNMMTSFPPGIIINTAPSTVPVFHPMKVCPPTAA